jgi:hypothetical protein
MDSIYSQWQDNDYNDDDAVGTYQNGTLNHGVEPHLNFTVREREASESKTFCMESCGLLCCDTIQ